jgi:hypothetical protein
VHGRLLVGDTKETESVFSGVLDFCRHEQNRHQPFFMKYHAFESGGYCWNGSSINHRI